MAKEVILIVGDGRGNVAKVKMSKRRLKEMIADSLWLGVLASSAIEGENIEGIPSTAPEELVDKIPDQLLRTDVK